jgi:hypothetical protein
VAPVQAVLEILAGLIVAMAAAALSLFGAKVETHRAPLMKPPVVSRSTVADQGGAAAAPGSLRAMPADCPEMKARRQALKA